ncbi:unnamed protein product [Rhizophagus irregularis]|uniref:Uncharacterized protein n=1 Tax=Rhizophagus irregularis TaxID=588596 RepID=A0A915ZKW9_9GLOM|nr:unnamed protein product [Rhizophagus irregularis]CAB5126640.1 unnamed protein product [Rhizophagus irregularis]CAB5381387.1 unnamed protein product [Rhizophagus irregularis]
MLYENINSLNEEDLEIWLLKTVKLPFVHVNKNIYVCYDYIYFSSYKNVSNFFYAYETSLLMVLQAKKTLE